MVWAEKHFVRIRMESHHPWDSFSSTNPSWMPWRSRRGYQLFLNGPLFSLFISSWRRRRRSRPSVGWGGRWGSGSRGQDWRGAQPAKKKTSMHEIFERAAHFFHRGKRIKVAQEFGSNGSRIRRMTFVKRRCELMPPLFIHPSIHPFPASHLLFSANVHLVPDLS